ncbi:MAG: hypothetical protein ACW968_09650, partial [Candidatus Thorarchaeota archaeon]
EPDATFIGAPDATITRNLKRWNGGFGYGGKLAWGDGSNDLLILDSMPNACGMLVGGLETLPDMDSLLEKVNSMLTMKRSSMVFQYSGILLSAIISLTFSDTNLQQKIQIFHTIMHSLFMVLFLN